MEAKPPVEDSTDFSERRYLAGMERLIGAVQELSLARDLATIQRIVRAAARELTGADGATFVLRDNGYCYYADENAISPLWKGVLVGVVAVAVVAQREGGPVGPGQFGGGAHDALNRCKVARELSRGRRGHLRVARQRLLLLRRREWCRRAPAAANVDRVLGPVVRARLGRILVSLNQLASAT